MTKTDIAKNVARFTIMLGTGKIVSGIIENNVRPKSTTDKVAIKGTSFVVGAAATELLGDWTDQKIDGVVAWWTKSQATNDYTF